MQFRTFLRTSAIAVMLAGGAVAVSATVASADVACNSYGECWNVRERPAITLYPPELGITFYGDDWRKAHERDTHYHWMRNRDEHGYYSHGEWHAFK